MMELWAVEEERDNREKADQTLEVAIFEDETDATVGRPHFRPSPNFDLAADQRSKLLSLIESTNQTTLVMQDFESRLRTKEDLLPKNHEAYHMNLAFYLQQCWANHVGAVVRPDMIYFTIINQIAKHVIRRKISNSSGDLRQSLETCEKLNLLRGTIDLSTLFSSLSCEVPGLYTEVMPQFSTDRNHSGEARYASFFEIVSPYYIDTKSFCGMPKIKLEGTRQDWQRLVDALEAWQKNETSFDPEFKQDYLAKVRRICGQILEDVDLSQMTASFWREFYAEESCGSGGSAVIGWICDLYNAPQKQPISRFKGDFTRVEWSAGKYGGKAKRMVVHHGLFSSKFDRKENTLVPEFSRLIFEIKPKNSGILSRTGRRIRKFLAGMCSV